MNNPSSDDQGDTAFCPLCSANSATGFLDIIPFPCSGMSIHSLFYGVHDTFIPVRIPFNYSRRSQVIIWGMRGPSQCQIMQLYDLFFSFSSGNRYSHLRIGRIIGQVERCSRRTCEFLPLLRDHTCRYKGIAQMGKGGPHRSFSTAPGPGQPAVFGKH